MKQKRSSTSALEILNKRYIADSPQRLASLKEERVNAEVARIIYRLREEVGLSQAELAKRVGTTQSVISRLEDADYQGHSLQMLKRVAMALNKRLTVLVTSEKEKRAVDHFVRNLTTAQHKGRDKKESTRLTP